MADIAAALLNDLKRDFGLTNEQAAGVVGNLMYESGGFNSLQELNPVVPGSRGGYGYAQWTGDRRNAFESYAAARGLEPSSYDANYGFIKHELATDPYERRQFNTVKGATTAAEAARLVSQNYLRPGKPNIAARQNLATQALGYAAAPRPSAPTPSAQSPRLSNIRSTTAPSGGNTALQNALGQLATRRGNAVTPMSRGDLTVPGAVQRNVMGMSQDQGAASAAETMAARMRQPTQTRYPTIQSGQGQAPRATQTAQRAPTSASDRARGQTAQSLTTPGAVSRSIAQTRQDPTLAAALAARAAPAPSPRSTVSASDMARGSPAQTRNVTTTVASYPTQTAARLPSISSGVGAAPATRSVPTTRVVPQNTNIAQQRNEQAVQRATAAPVARSVPMATGVQQSYAGQDRAPVARAASIPGPNRVAQTTDRLPASPATPLGFNPAATGGAAQSGGLSRDAVARQAAYSATTVNPPAAVRQPAVTAAMPPMPIARPPMQPRLPAIQPQVAMQPAVVAPPVVRQPQIVMGAAPQRAPLNVLVQGSNTVQPPAPPPMSAIAQLQAQGLTSAQAYSALSASNNPANNHDAASRINSSAGSRFDSGADSFY